MRRLRDRYPDTFKRIETRLKSGKLRSNVQHALPFWIASFITGLIAVVYTRLFGFSESLLSRLLVDHKWYIFLLAPISFLLAWLTVKWFAPNAKGSGIPQVMAALDISGKNDSSISKLLSLRIAITKIGSSLLMVLGGGAIGREGPTIQIAASVFRTVNRRIPQSWPRLSPKSFMLTGAAAGLAAAFNTPLGGIVFAIEELAKIHLSHFRTALFTAVIIAGLTAQGFIGPYLYLGYPDVSGLSNSIFIPVAITAVVTGLLGALMGKVTLKLLNWKRTLGITKNVFLIIMIGLLIASIAFFIDANILGSGKSLINTLLFTPNKTVQFSTTIVRVLGPVLTFNVGAAGGIFAPSLAAGASIGAYVSSLFSVTGAGANLLVLSGMVGFLTGITRTPFTSAILVLEMTDRHSIIFHLMLASVISNFIALLVDKHSFYDRLKSAYINDALEPS